jgi:hypothetical protein
MLHFQRTFVKTCFFRIALVMAGFTAAGMTNAQSNYLPGYIIDAQGDTISGLVDYQNWIKTPKTVGFKARKEGRKVNYTPLEIKGFSVQNEIYTAAIVNTSFDPVNIDRLTRSQELTLVLDTVFLQAVILGDKSLYFAKNDHYNDNFYISDKDSFQLLMYKRYIKATELAYLAAENKYFISQLQSYLGDCPSITVHLSSTNYALESLVHLFKEYQDCVQSKATYQKKKEVVAIEFGVCAGATHTFMGFRANPRNTSFNFLSLGDFSESYNFTAGLFFDVVQKKKQGRWSLSNEMLYTSFNIEGYYEEYITENHYNIHTTQFKYSHLKLNNLLRYRYPIGNVRVFLNAGLSHGFFVSGFSRRTKELYLHNFQRVSEDEPIDDPLKVDPGYIYGAGLQANRFSLEIRGEKSSGISRIVALGTPTKRTFLLLRYRI